MLLYNMREEAQCTALHFLLNWRNKSSHRQTRIRRRARYCDHSSLLSPCVLLHDSSPADHSSLISPCVLLHDSSPAHSLEKIYSIRHPDSTYSSRRGTYPFFQHTPAMFGRLHFSRSSTENIRISKRMYSTSISFVISSTSSLPRSNYLLSTRISLQGVVS
jgi:hypothetical protein